jgi:hypothetical protein
MTREKQIREAAWIASMTEETIVREEVIKNKVHVGYKDVKLRDNDKIIARLFFRKGVEWADANQPNPWISVEDKLPDDGVLVIVAYRWILGEILYASDVFHIDYGWEDYDDIVAWMPIPQLPKEE